MLVKIGFLRHWSSLRQMMWLFQTVVGKAERDPTSDGINIGRVDYMTLTS